MFGPDYREVMSAPVHPLVRSDRARGKRRGRSVATTGSGFGVLRAARRGTVTLEFALIAPALLTLLLTILEVGLILFGQAALDTATADAARLIRTGQVQRATAGQSLFTSRLCSDLSGIVPCGNVTLNVQSGSSFAALNATVAVSASGGMAATGFTPGGPGQFVVVQVSYQPDTFVPLVGQMLRAAFGSLLVSTVTFQNEAY